MEQNGAPAGDEELISVLAAGATVRQAAETPPVVMIDNTGGTVMLAAKQPT
jgi:hypothetical protein